MKAFRLFGMYIFRTSCADHFRPFSNVLLQGGNGICHDAFWPPLSPLIYIIKKECIKIHYIISSIHGSRCLILRKNIACFTGRKNRLFDTGNLKVL